MRLLAFAVFLVLTSSRFSALLRSFAKQGRAGCPLDNYSALPCKRTRPLDRRSATGLGHCIRIFCADTDTAFVPTRRGWGGASPPPSRWKIFCEKFPPRSPYAARRTELHPCLHQFWKQTPTKPFPPQRAYSAESYKLRIQLAGLSMCWFSRNSFSHFLSAGESSMSVSISYKTRHINLYDAGIKTS